MSNFDEFFNKLDLENPMRVEDNLGHGYVRLRSTEAQRRQAKQDIRCSEDIVLELLRNARDAKAQHIFLATWQNQSFRTFVCIDDGIGIPKELTEKIFEPRVTSKLDAFVADRWGVHGRGMALYSIAENTQSASVLKSDLGAGASVEIVSDTTKLKERTEQSCLPSIVTTEDGTLHLRGPRNIARCVCEFAFTHRNLKIYLGSATEIAASISHVLETEDVAEAWLGSLLTKAHSIANYTKNAAELGLVMSERSARRIIDGDIAPIMPLMDVILAKYGKDQGAGSAQELPKQQRRVSSQGNIKAARISDADKEVFVLTVKRAFAELAQAYYLDADVEPSLRVSADSLKLSIPLVALDDAE